MSLVGEERKRIILERIDGNGRVSVSELAEDFSVSTETIRRYLVDLDKEQKLKKVYGGAVKIHSTSFVEPAMFEREVLRAQEKKRIAHKAATFVNDGDVIVIDEGSTPLQMIPYLVYRKRLTIVTNSFPLVTRLISAINTKSFDGEVLFIGGKVNSKHARATGPISQQMISQFHFDKAFISVDAVLPSFGISSVELEKAKLSEVMIKQAKQVFVLADHSKMGLKGNYRITSLQKVDVLISDKDIPKNWHADLERAEVQWITC
ncbi:DeoR/GlpR family DNA-binding transcription regulator [Ectobacillus sp. JY-23]|uniref:DeoR/GlpR family DNA-binding transcription regulator n=1 Tax=Ectobacillus sp. JY-23 TaxID=2933872 RepID=UPI001FF155F3|nr:DeoR/GlpR family DNA-binding transcription regulator [Ectobacillus sp. JY-23]UOY91904.1 DeoR/GlpR family DNA-binding transcription regulator [Ectobacillus sp. JY-23]